MGDFIMRRARPLTTAVSWPTKRQKRRGCLPFVRFTANQAVWQIRFQPCPSLNTVVIVYDAASGFKVVHNDEELPIKHVAKVG